MFLWIFIIIYNMSQKDEGFIVVQKKKKYRPKYNDNNKSVRLDRENVIERARNIVKKYKPYAVYLYGSTARDQHNATSDIDIFVIWRKKYPENQILESVYSDLYNEFNRRVDFVSYVYDGKSIKVKSSDSCFVQNVIDDAVSILEPKKNTKSIAIKDILFEFDCYDC